MQEEYIHDISLQEHAAWQTLCRALADAGAVTEEDLQAPPTERDTPGKQLLELIRNWGDLEATRQMARPVSKYTP